MLNFTTISLILFEKKSWSSDKWCFLISTTSLKKQKQFITAYQSQAHKYMLVEGKIVLIILFISGTQKMIFMNILINFLNAPFHLRQRRCQIMFLFLFTPNLWYKKKKFFWEPIFLICFTNHNILLHANKD